LECWKQIDIEPLNIMPLQILYIPSSMVSQLAKTIMIILFDFSLQPEHSMILVNLEEMTLEFDDFKKIS
jgi:hypothetical protein